MIRALVLCAAFACAATLWAGDVSFRLYQISGRTWTIKIMPTSSGDGNLEINYTRYEVLEVHEDYALVSSVRLDTKKQIPKGVTPTQSRIRFNAELPPFKPAEGSANQGVKTIKAAGMNFECDVWSSGTPPSTYYYSTRYPGLLVRTEANFGIDELCEFDAFKDDEPPAPPKKGQKPPKEAPPSKDSGQGKEEPKTPDEFALFKAKRAWIVSSKLEGGATGYRKYEVLKWDETGADIKATELDAAKKPLKGGKVETLRVEFKEGEAAKFALPEGATKDRAEKRRYGANVMACTVYSFKKDGKEGQVWVSSEYPGLLVRMTYDGVPVSELVEFK